MKNVKYILIIVVLIGFFGPTIRTNASGELGECTVTRAGSVTHAQTTKEACLAIANDNTIVTWIPSQEAQDAGITGTTSGGVATGYHLLAPLPCENGTVGCVNGKLTTFQPEQSNSLGAYLNIMIKIFIGICAVLSVVMIIVGGMEYMTSELISSKEAGKEKIEHALLGLIIALGAYALLFTINPNLLKSDINPPAATVTIPPPGTSTENCSDPQYTTVEDCTSHGGTVD